MSNQLKLIVIKKNNKKKIKSKFNQFIEEIKSNEMEKLKSPIKGQLFVYLDDNNNYFFYQFTGKSWIEVK